MGKLAVYKYFSFMFLVITVLLAILTFFGLFGGSANPVHETAMAMIVYVLPFLIGGNLVMLVFWLLRRRWHWVAIPAVTVLCCLPYLGTLYQFGFFSADDQHKTGYKVATYNVAMFGREISGFKAEDILSEMKRQDVYILCLQEYRAFSGDKNNTENYKSFFPHMAVGHDDMVIFSRFPIRQSAPIEFGPTNNSAMWADVDINGRKLRVFNVHLETTGFNRTLRKMAKMELQGAPVENSTIISAIYGNYTRGMVVRARQSNIVARAVRESPYPVIVCGDFNDVPYSYTYHVMKGDLVDGFKECGQGFMSTFRGDKTVRIDYIFHSESLTGLSYFTHDLSYSDHKPVFLKMAY